MKKVQLKRTTLDKLLSEAVSRTLEYAELVYINERNFRIKEIVDSIPIDEFKSALALPNISPETTKELLNNYVAVIDSKGKCYALAEKHTLSFRTEVTPGIRKYFCGG